MGHPTRAALHYLLIFACLVSQVLLPAATAGGGKLILMDNTEIEGTIVFFKSIKGGPAVGPEDYRTVVTCNDQLRRYYVANRYVSEAIPADINQIPPVKIQLTHHRIPPGGNVVAVVGAPMRVTEFDERGVRIFTMATDRGKLDVIQGITEITPRYAKLVALEGENRQRLLWDTRVATSSIPHDRLRRILYRAIDKTDLKQRMLIFNLFLQMERFREARTELETIFEEFPNAEADFGQFVTTLRQLEARRIVREIELRGAAGQHMAKYAFLKQFPSDGVAGETLQQVSKLIEEHDSTATKGREIIARLRDLTDKIESDLQEQIKPVIDEIALELNFNTIERMAPFETISENENAKPDESLAMAVSGWICGPQTATANLPVAFSLIRVREIVRKYLRAGLQVDRVNLLKELADEEGADPQYVAPMLEAMKPPLATESQANGFYELEVESVPGAMPFRYYVQLPPEYDPYKKYPTVVTLHGGFTTPQTQIDWWAGPTNESGARVGQASRHGYIIVSPAWAGPHQTSYEYSRAEHLAVLYSLRDACGRFSVDTDRVFLSGHSMGGDAAWDIGLAHPDLWAGVIPVAATAGKYVNLYWENAKLLPMYFVSGELDGDRKEVNAVTQDRYLSRAFPTRICEFLGRGHEPFSDEILDLFEWMRIHRRDFFPRDFKALTMRPWDSFFWWIEVEGLPQKSMVEPDFFSRRPRGTAPAVLEGEISNNNIVRIRSGAKESIVWLSPEMVDFNQPITIRSGGRTIRYNAEDALPNVEVVLEDARTRGDRQHPFWAKVVVAGR
ncbi:MAG: alpha/beta hydrolase-fold protein [Pirellulales bacterium]|nr:alpha/beta hydrolase-fold protein [Pirellulales bacterium]